MSWRHFAPAINSLRPRLNRRPFADDIFKCIFLNVNEWILPRISLKFVPEVRINNIPALVKIMAWRRPGGKPLSEPMMVSLMTLICVTRPQWVKLRTPETRRPTYVSLIAADALAPISYHFALIYESYFATRITLQPSNTNKRGLEVRQYI